jgi:transaldolase
VVISPPFEWQVRLNESGIVPRPRMDAPVEPRILAELQRFTAFRRAYEEGGLAPADFDTFGPTLRTLRQFLAATADLAALVRDQMVPNPD